ncbi:type II toxin-antitoxin system VapC family toxin [Methylobacterium pseudosasicola]|uniref:Ribonuclease VapC n=1 Tax=Methylobacterium pseudosasicola TaxID=582667 RepID=A0A1I4I0X4_9HYPH|nr:type II toxin-antitoxin system VapC family toxin [Methylobacterium pseudosasicola]SFL47830.1 ribonuclease VapC [Methylobacterium pseudosasicola]
MFVDASAMVAILADEPGAGDLIRCLDAAEMPITSVLAVFETATALTRKLAQDLAASESQILRFLLTSGIRIVPIGAPESHEALTAYARFGKGRHPARLNLGDCFTYACAQVHGVPLLFVGDDFPQTDIRSALA